MRLADYIERTRIVNLDLLPADSRTALLESLEKQPSLAALEPSWAETLSSVPMEHLRRLSEACRNWREREDTLRRVLSDIEKQGLSIPSSEALDRALVPHKVEALARAVRLCPGTDNESEDHRTKILFACIDAWSGAVNLAIKRGELACHLHQSHPQAQRFAEYARRREALSGLAGHRWLAMRRGERLGALSIAFTWPLSNITALIETFRPRMGEKIREMTTDDLVEKFVVSHLEKAIRGVLDRKVEDEAIRSAVSLYSELLSSPPLCEPPVAAVSVGRPGAPLGVAVVGKTKAVLDHALVDPTADWHQDVLAALTGHGIECVVVPRSAPDQDRLAELRKVLASEYAVHAVRNAALAEARSLVLHQHPELKPAVASAVVLATRALDPSREWSKVNPVGLGLAEYQNDLDIDRLQIALKDALILHRWEHNRKTPTSRQTATKTQPKVPKTPAGRPKRIVGNPLVKSLTDLKPGMTVQGVVSNMTRFGVFVDLGLEEEAMIHISELSDSFVSSPTEVVSLGQTIQARVLGLDLPRKRVALTMKSPPPKRREARRERRAPKNKADALAQLENLFKK